MPPKRQGLGAGTASKRPPEAAKLADPKLIRALYTKFHQGKQRQALEALEEHNRAHPSGLGYLALSRMHALLGMREALQVEDADERELVLLRHLHKALGASVRGAAEHRSLQCVCMAAHIGVAVRGRGGELAKEREALWEPLEQRYTPHTGALKKDAEGWADPLLEELPVHLPTDRWPVDTTVRAAARTSDGVATYSQETRRLLQEILDRRGTDDLFATCPTIRLVGSDYKPVEDSLVAGKFFPKGPTKALADHIQSLGAQQQRRQVQEAGNDDRHKKRIVVKHATEADEARERARQSKQAALQRKTRELQLKEAQQRADMLRAYLQSRMEAGREQEVAAAEASVPLSRFVLIVNELEGKGALKPEQAQRARTAAGLMAKETAVYYSLPPALQAGEAVGQQQRRHEASEAQGAPGGQPPMLRPEQVASAIRQAAVERFSWEEQRAFLEQQQPQWKSTFDIMVNLHDVTAEAFNPLSTTVPILDMDRADVQEVTGDAELLQGDPCSHFIAATVTGPLMAARRLQQQPARLTDDVDSATDSDDESSPSSSSSPFPSPVKPQKAEEPEDKSAKADSSHAGTATHYLDKQYLDTTEMSFKIGACIGLPSEPSVPGILDKNKVLPDSKEAQASHLLAQALLGHCMLRELRGEVEPSQSPVLKAAAWVREAQKHDGRHSLQQLVEAATATEEDPCTASRMAACVASLRNQAKQTGVWSAKSKQPVDFCAALSLAMAPRPQGEGADAAVTQAKLWAAQDVVSALRHLQERRRMTVSVMAAVLALLQEPRVVGGGADIEQGNSEGQLLYLARVQFQLERLAAAEGTEKPRAMLSQQLRQLGGKLKLLGQLPLRDLMRVHAYVCLHLAWQFPLVADFVHHPQDALCVEEGDHMPCELTKGDMLRIPPSGIKWMAQQKCTGAGISEHDGLQAAPAARQPGSSQGEAVMAAAALPSSQEDWAGMLAAAACGLPQRAADSQLLASSHAVDAPPRDNETAGEAQATSQLAILQHAMALRALLGTLLRQAELDSHHGRDYMDLASNILERMRREPEVVVALSDDAMCDFSVAPKFIEKVTRDARSLSAILESINASFSRSSEVRELQRVELELLKAQQLKAPKSKRQEEAEVLRKLSICRDILATHLDTPALMSELEIALKTSVRPEEKEFIDMALQKLKESLLATRKCQRDANLQLWERQIRSGLANSLFFLRNVLSECLSKQLVPVLLELTNLVDVITVMEARLVSLMRAGCCARVCAAEVGGVLLHHVLPAKWEQDMAQASAGGKVLESGSSLTDKKAAEAAAAALLEQEEREAEARRARLAKVEKKKAKRVAQQTTIVEEAAQQQQEQQQHGQVSEAPTSPAVLQASPSSAPSAVDGQQERQALASPPETGQQQQVQQSSANSAQQHQQQQRRQAPASPTRQHQQQHQQQQGRQPQENGTHTAANSEPDLLQHFRARGDIEPGEKALPKLSETTRKGASAAGIGKHGKHAAALSPKSGEAVASRQPGSGGSKAVQGSQAGQADADPSPGAALQRGAQGQNGPQQQPAGSSSHQPSKHGQVEAASGLGTAVRQENASSQKPSSTGAARSSVSTSSSTASSSSSSGAASRLASSQALAQQPAASAHSAAGGLGPAAAAAAAASPAVSSSGPSRHSGKAAVAPPAPSEHSSSSLEAELAAQRRLAEQQGWIGPDGEIDITKLDQLAALYASMPRGPSAAAAPAPAQPNHAGPGPVGRQGQGPARQPAPAMVPPRTAPASMPGAQGLRDARPAATPAAPDRPPSAEGASAPAQQAQRPQLKRGVGDMRFVKWEGEWKCHCGRVNSLRDDCSNCQQWAPCREWFLGRCAQGDSCRMAHPPFDLPKSKPPTNERGLALHNGKPIANPPPGALYVKQQPPIKPAAKPAAVVQTWRGQTQPPQPVPPQPAHPQPVPPQPAQWAQPNAAAQRAQPNAVAQRAQPIAAAQRQPEAEPPAPSAWARPAAAPAAPPAGAWAAVAAPEAAGAAKLPSSAKSRPAEGAAHGGDARAGAPRASVPQQVPYAAAAAKPAAGLPSSTAQPPKAGAWSSGVPAAAAVPAPSAQLAPPAAPAQQTWAARAAAAQQVPATPAISVELRPAAGTPSVASAPAEEEELEAMLQNMGVSSASSEVEVPAAAGAWGFREPQAAVKPQAAVPLGQAAWPSIGQDQEDADLMAAMQASLADAAQQHQQQLSALAAAGAAGPAGGPAGRREAAAAEAPELARPALSNETGEYNCFLNVIIQCLWYCTEFRQQVSAWPDELWHHNAVLSALRGLFLAFEDEEEGKRNRTIAAGARQAIDPTPLREALAALPHGQFKQGEMSDAAEVLDALYGEIKSAAGKLGRGSARRGVDTLFGLAVRERVECARCGKSTHESSYLQYFYTTQATSIRMQRALSLDEASSDAPPGSVSPPPPSLGRLLHLIEQQARKTCDTDVGGCGEWNGVLHFLERAPRVFTLQLAWESHQEAGADIAATLAGIDEQVDLGEVYCAHEPGQDVYRLRSLVCYYGAHYQAFVLVPDLGRWLLFDDTRVSNIGTWADVLRKCELGRIQPSVLFYEAAAPAAAAGAT